MKYLMTNRKAQISLEMILIASIILVFALGAAKYLRDRGEAEKVKMETELGKG